MARWVGGESGDTARAQPRCPIQDFRQDKSSGGPVAGSAATEKTEPARRVRPEVCFMRRKRLAGGRISEWGSVTGTLAARVKPKPRGAETEPRAYLSPRPVRLTGPVRRGGDAMNMRSVEVAWIDLRPICGEGWECWGLRSWTLQSAVHSPRSGGRWREATEWGRPLALCWPPSTGFASPRAAHGGGT